MKTKELREKDTTAIESELKDMQKHLFDLKTQAVTEKLENPRQLRNARRDIARMKTILRQRSLEQAPKTQKTTEKKTEKAAK